MATFSAIKNKTQSASALSRVLDYVSQKKKTLWEDRQLVSGWNCVAKASYDEMMTTKRRFHKTGGRMFYQFVQSFSPDENVTPQEVHAMGLELAQKLFPEFEVVVATHLDTKHIHNHLVVNSVSCEDGHKLHQNPADLQRQRQISDELCLAHGLRVLEKPKRYADDKKMRPGEYRSARKGQSWKFQLINTIDLCMRRAKSREEFIREMERRGYQVRWERNRKAITYTTPKGMRCRDDRLHEDKYRKEVMEREFWIREAILHGGVEEAEPAARDATVSPALSDTGTVEYSAERPDSSVPAAGGAERYDGEDALYGRDIVQASGEAGQGDRVDPATDPTSWEQERGLAFAAQDPSAPAQPHVAVVDPGLGGLVGDVVRLGYHLERTLTDGPTAPVTGQGHSDRKTLSKERKKKLAMGHKPDDHEEEQTWQQQM